MYAIGLSLCLHCLGRRVLGNVVDHIDSTYPDIDVKIRVVGVPEPEPHETRAVHAKQGKGEKSFVILQQFMETRPSAKLILNHAIANVTKTINTECDPDADGDCTRNYARALLHHELLLHELAHCAPFDKRFNETLEDFTKRWRLNKDTRPALTENGKEQEYFTKENNAQPHPAAIPAPDYMDLLPTIVFEQWQALCRVHDQANGACQVRYDFLYTILAQATMNKCPWAKPWSTFLELDIPEEDALFHCHQRANAVANQFAKLLRKESQETGPHKDGTPEDQKC